MRFALVMLSFALLTIPVQAGRLSSFSSTRSFSSRSYSYSRPSTSFSNSLKVRPMPRVLPKATPSLKESAPRPPTTTATIPAPRPIAPSYSPPAPAYSPPPTVVEHHYSGPSWFDFWLWSYLFQPKPQAPVVVAPAPAAPTPVVHCGDNQYLDKNNICQIIPKCGADQHANKDGVCETNVGTSGGNTSPDFKSSLDYKAK